jgi:hypothetical protein
VGQIFLGKRIVFQFLTALILILTGLRVSAAQQDAGASLSFGLNGISDWSTQHPFLDHMKSARPWVGHLPDQWGGISFEDLMAEGVLDEHGWPVSIPVRATKIEALLLTDQPEDAVHLAGKYRVVYDGSGDVNVTGRGRVVRRTDGVVVFDYQPGSGAVGIAIERTEPDNPIRNIRVIKEDHKALYDQGVQFNPLWIDRLGDVHSVRFMDWMDTNNSPVVTWADLPDKDDFSYAWRGVPLEVMIALSNELDANPWFTLPHLSDDALVREFAERSFGGLEADRLVYVEFSNEVWNFIFEQARWAQRNAEQLWGEGGDGWMQYYGLRASQVMQIWADVFGSSADHRLRRVVSVHTGWPGLEESVLFGANAEAELGAAPAEYFDAYAVTGYFGYELGFRDTLTEHLDEAEDKATQDGELQGLSRVALREYVKKHRFDGVSERAAEIVRTGSLGELTEDLWPYHAKVARAAGLDLIMYEGGTHAAAVAEANEDERLVSFLNEFNYSDQMAGLYEYALESWSNVGGLSFNAFVDVAPPSRWGSWGSLRHLNDDSPRWQVLQTARQPDK